MRINFATRFSFDMLYSRLLIERINQGGRYALAGDCSNAHQRRCRERIAVDRNSPPMISWFYENPSGC